MRDQKTDISALAHPLDETEKSTVFSARLGERCERIVHESGLPILLFPKQSVTTYAMLVIRFGAQDRAFTCGGEAVRLPDGVAHFLEHKLFARPDGSDVNEHFSSLGAEANAWTDYDKTAYLFSTTEAADDALRVLIDFVSTPYFTKENVVRERGIIREEIAMGEDDPWQRIYEQTMQATYGRHPIRRKICGTASSVARITPALLKTAYEAFYRPDHAYLVVCGDMDMKRILAAVDEPLRRWANKTEYRPTPIRKKSGERTGVVRRRATGYGAVSQPLFQISWKDTPPPNEPSARLRREVAMSLLSEVLFCRAGRLYHTLYEGGLITPGYSYGYSTLGGEDGIAYHAISGESDNPDAVFDAYARYLDEMRKTGLCDADIERCRRVAYATFVSEFDFVDDIADLMCEAEGYGGGVFDTLAIIECITKEELQALFADSFSFENTVFSALYPDGGHALEPKIKEDQ